MNYVKPLPPPRALDMSFFSCVPADFKRAGAKTKSRMDPRMADLPQFTAKPFSDPMAEALAEVMPVKPKGKARKARLPLDKT